MAVLSLILRVFSRGFLMCGILGLLAGCGFGISQSIWVAHTATARGSIVELVPVHDPYQKKPTFAPRFKYRSDGHSYVVTSSVRCSAHAFVVGEEVRVRYLKSDPEAAKLDRFWQLWLIPFVCVAGGVCSIVTGYLLLWLERRLRRWARACSPLTAPGC